MGSETCAEFDRLLELKRAMVALFGVWIEQSNLIIITTLPHNTRTCTM